MKSCTEGSAELELLRKLSPPRTWEKLGFLVRDPAEVHVNKATATELELPTISLLCSTILLSTPFTGVHEV